MEAAQHLVQKIVGSDKSAPPQPTAEELQKLRSTYEKANQDHVFAFYDSLSSSDQATFYQQLSQFDPARINEITDRALNPPAAAADEPHAGVEPLPESATASILDSAPEDLEKWNNAGLDLIAANKVAVLLLAGGQGTRLGSSAPKGCYDIGLPSKKSLFQIQGERIRKIQRLAEKKAGTKAGSVTVPWYVMTSGPTRGPTEKYFQENGYFGLQKENVHIFEQGVLPCISNEGKILLESKGRVAVAPNGNGGIYEALVTSDITADMRKRGIEHIHAYCVDNCLAKVADPVFIGFSASKNVSIATKVVRKRNATESVGLIVLKNGKPDVVEYSEIDKATAEAKDPKQPDVLKFRAANIVNHYYSFSFLETIPEWSAQLPHHVARKKIPFVEPSTGETTKPEKPNGIKLEMFIFDVFPLLSLDKFACMEVRREDEFSPLKNAKGTGQDDPDTSRHDVLAQGERWVRAAGAVVTTEGDKEGVEVSPLVATGCDCPIGRADKGQGCFRPPTSKLWYPGNRRLAVEYAPSLAAARSLFIGHSTLLNIMRLWEQERHDDPHSYTGGRWLNRDELERSSRFVMFDFPALCERVIRACTGATSVVEYEKREGGFNRVFLLTMDNWQCVVARAPTGIAGPPRLTTNSEVTTMSYLQSKISLPIPRILDWSDDPSNPTGTEYIIQEHVAGVQLHQEWPKMSMEQHMLCTKSLSLTMKKMASLDFPAYGSLYFADAPIDSGLKIPFERGFVVGPHCSPVFWNRNPGEQELYRGPSPNCGPWRDLTSYCRGLIDTGFSRLPKEEAIDTRQTLPYQGSIQDHIRLLESSREVMQKLVEDTRIQDAAIPTLLHADFHKRNIYVSAEDPTVITGLIDLQSTSIEPAFIYANETPDFAAPPIIRSEDGALDHELDEGVISKQKGRELKDASICNQTYDVVMTALIPKLRPARLLDPTLFRLFHYTHTTWRDSAPAVRQELIERSARWTELGLEGSCPFSPTEAELKEHARDYEDFEAVQALKLRLKRTFDTNSDGWVPNDEWDAARVMHRKAYEEWIETAREAEVNGEEMTVEKAEKMWPFDAR
ncbi:hypothetical protein V495_06163 [Pseudogymnoascus sp. VKM F-4514 (FW-929)]|nr:hypothetical protein V495_06163 [Pseudogymnoascus sp. VKM F-4514 (FW-929)]KFY55716.1 hypothetical protein V497_06780 [Pseudogymnoascus sp. VKM F-4516 (FW-969)]